MQLLTTAIADVFLLEPRVYQDERGFFLESFNQAVFNKLLGSPVAFVQDNHSRSKQGVLRGLHYQLEHTQGKLVRCVSGSVFDVAVDLRRSSPSYGQWVGYELSAQNQRQLWIPPGCAHGFLVLSDSADFLYKTTDYWHAASEACLRWDDPELGIAWPIQGLTIQVNAKDQQGLSWQTCPKF